MPIAKDFLHPLNISKNISIHILIKITHRLHKLCRKVPQKYSLLYCWKRSVCVKLLTTKVTHKKWSAKNRKWMDIKVQFDSTCLFHFIASSVRNAVWKSSPKKILDKKGNIRTKTTGCFRITSASTALPPNEPSIPKSFLNQNIAVGYIEIFPISS